LFKYDFSLNKRFFNKFVKNVNFGELLKSHTRASKVTFEMSKLRSTKHMLLVTKINYHKERFSFPLRAICLNQQTGWRQGLCWIFEA